MEDKKNKTVKAKLTDAGLTVKGLKILLAFSFVATVIAFSVAYIEHIRYDELVDRYDDVMVRISECEASVEALMNTSAVIDEVTYTTGVTASVKEEAESTSYVYTENTTDKHQETTKKGSEDTQQTTKETTTAGAVTSSTYYVTQNGKKYHIASCSYLKKSKIAITADRIKAEGYSPCSRCIK